MYKTAVCLDYFIKRDVLDYTTSFIPPLFIQVPVPSTESERSCIYCMCVREVYILPLSIIVLLDFGTVSPVWLFKVIHLLQALQSYYKTSKVIQLK